MKNLFAAIFMLAATSAMADDAARITQLSNQVQAVYSAINTLNADLSCQADTDCLTIAVGHRACGGPSGYITSSNLNPHVADNTVANLADLTTSLARELNQLNHTISICIIEMPQPVGCVSNVCSTIVE